MFQHLLLALLFQCILLALHIMDYTILLVLYLMDYTIGTTYMDYIIGTTRFNIYYWHYFSNVYYWHYISWTILYYWYYILWTILLVPHIWIILLALHASTYINGTTRFNIYYWHHIISNILLALLSACVLCFIIFIGTSLSVLYLSAPHLVYHNSTRTILRKKFSYMVILLLRRLTIIHLF